MTTATEARNSKEQQELQLTGKYLTFDLGEEGYGIEIRKVREIIGLMKITAMPQAPNYIKGIINLRGRVIPVLDLRLKFGMTDKEYNDRTCIIVVEIGEGEAMKQVGMLVDAVSEVLQVGGAAIEPPPALGDDVNTECILGMAKEKGEIVILLDVDKVIKVTALPNLTEQTIH